MLMTCAFVDNIDQQVAHNLAHRLEEQLEFIVVLDFLRIFVLSGGCTYMATCGHLIFVVIHFLLQHVFCLLNVAARYMYVT